jgi:hypothetical protein
MGADFIAAWLSRKLHAGHSHRQLRLIVTPPKIVNGRPKSAFRVDHALLMAARAGNRKDTGQCVQACGR